VKKLFLTLLLLSGFLAAGQQQKTIKDPAEYNAYIAALNTQDAAAKAAAMEAFVRQYPQSVVLEDALEQAMTAYQQAGNMAKVEATAKRILQLAPNSIRPMAILVALGRNRATQGDQAALKETCAYAQTGLQQLASWSKPEGISDADFGKLRGQIGAIFNGAAGFCALQAKDYTGARDAYTKSVAIDPTNLQDVYQLSVANLEMSPMDLNGLWYCSKAIQLAQGQNNGQAVKGMVTYCKSKYRKYHGSDDGWDQLVAAAAPQNALPANFAAGIKRAATPCELAVQAVKENDPSSLSFSDKEFILSKANCSPENKDAADKIWQSIQTMEKNGEARLQIPAKVIAVSTDSIECAIGEDNQQANKADMHVMMEKPMVRPPAQGSMINIIGVITTYVSEPFMFTMEKGALQGAK
jgi:tetratricopeptide (TPR) repeat protein